MQINTKPYYINVLNRLRNFLKIYCLYIFGYFVITYPLFTECTYTFQL